MINLLTDCSHDYSFNLSYASRNEKDVFPGINCLTSGRTIHKLELRPVNALVVLVDGKLPYHADDAPHLLDYVKGGGGLVVFHFACAAFPKWKEYNEIIGLGGWGGRNEKDGPYIRWRDGKAVRDTTPGRGGGHGRS